MFEMKKYKFNNNDVNHNDLLKMKCSVRNNNRTSDIYRLNETFVRLFVISPDILSGGVGSGLEFRMGNPHPHTSQCHVNRRSFRSRARNKRKQPRVVREQHCLAVGVFCLVPDVVG